MQRFVDALHRLEQTRDASAMEALFAEDAELGSEADGRAALEWVSRGETRSGEDFSSEGVTFLEFDVAGRIPLHLTTVTDTTYASPNHGP